MLVGLPLNARILLWDIVPNNNFWLNEEGISYSYNQYEIAPTPWEL